MHAERVEPINAQRLHSVACSVKKTKSRAWVSDEKKPTMYLSYTDRRATDFAAGKILALPSIGSHQ